MDPKILKRELKRKKILNEKDIVDLQRKIAKKYKIFLPNKIDILTAAKELNIKTNFKKKPIRSLSGVAIVAVLTKNFPCPGKCIYCPNEKNLPKSYLSGEPAVERAKKLNFDPYLQIQERIKALEKEGHSTDKIELIIIGGTWSALPSSYQKEFIKQCFKGANECDKKSKAEKKSNKSLLEVQKINEKARHRIIGLTLETRPDYITLKEIEKMRIYGCTRVELGVQSIEDRILKINHRGHNVETTIKATKLLKDAGFKICYHIMPGLLGSNPKLDLKQFKTLFEDERFRPDMLKIYPCVITKGSKLYTLFLNGQYRSYIDKTLIKLLVEMKKSIPPYVRLLRLIRDIPSNSIISGIKISNLREVVQKKMNEEGYKCQCIRCREIKTLPLNFKNIKLVRRDYDASLGKEVFLSFEDLKQDKLLAFLRLRLPQNPEYPSSLSKSLNGAALIREIHTYGELTPLGKKIGAIQHYSLGKKLIKKAEEIAQQANYKKIAVISGIGVRDYWRKNGYHLSETYMIKKLKY